MSYSKEVRIILTGKTGAGKSAVGNTILGRIRFGSSFSSLPVTRRCQKENAVFADKMVTVIDTPDFPHSTHEEDFVSEIERSVKLSSPGVHAFLFVLKPETFTKQEEETVTRFKQIYGEDVFRHTIVLFTYGDKLQQVSNDMSKLISKNESLRNLVNLCGGRFAVLNNEAPTDRLQVYYLLNIIDRMISANENSLYSEEMLQEARRRAEEQREMYLTQQRSLEESARVKHQRDLESAKMETEIRVRKEIEEEQKRASAANEEPDTCNTDEETEISAEQDLQRRDNKTYIHLWFILQPSQVYIIIFFSVAFGCMFNEMYQVRWAWVHGCVVGASATAGGHITGKLVALLQRSHSRMSCIISHKVFPNVPNQWKKVFISTCGGLVGASITYGYEYMGPNKTPVPVFGFMAGSLSAYTVLRAHG